MFCLCFAFDSVSQACGMFPCEHVVCVLERVSYVRATMWSGPIGQESWNDSKPHSAITGVLLNCAFTYWTQRQHAELFFLYCQCGADNPASWILPDFGFFLPVFTSKNVTSNSRMGVKQISERVLTLKVCCRFVATKRHDWVSSSSIYDAKTQGPTFTLAIGKKVMSLGTRGG